jgi:hypothetical protein
MAVLYRLDRHRDHLETHAVCRLECISDNIQAPPKTFLQFLGIEVESRRSVLKVLISRSSFIILELRTEYVSGDRIDLRLHFRQGIVGRIGTRSSPVTRAKPLPFGLGRG